MKIVLKEYISKKEAGLYDFSYYEDMIFLMNMISLVMFG